MAEKGLLFRDNSDVSRLITGHAVNATGDNSKNTLHAYEVALKSTHDKCQRQAEQLRQLTEEGRRHLADKAELHSEIERLRESAGRQRERAGQLHRQLATSHRESSELRHQVALQHRQLAAALRRLEEAGVAPPPSLEQANRDTDEMHVQLSVAAPGWEEEEQQRGSSPEVGSMTEEEIARRLSQLQQAGQRSLLDSFDGVLTGLQLAATVDGVPRRAQPSRVVQAVRQCNASLRRAVTNLRQLQERGAVVMSATAPSGASLPPLQEIPLTTSPPPGRPGLIDGATDAPSDLEPPTCPICGEMFRPPATRQQFEDHVYAHVLDMVAEESIVTASPPAAASATATRAVV